MLRCQVTHQSEVMTYKCNVLDATTCFSLVLASVLTLVLKISYSFICSYSFFDNQIIDISICVSDSLSCIHVPRVRSNG